MTAFRLERQAFVRPTIANINLRDSCKPAFTKLQILTLKNFYI